MLTITDGISPPVLPDHRCPDTYFTVGYGVAAAQARGGRWHCAYWDDAIVLPYVVNNVDGGHRDAVSPYGYSGLYVSPTCSADDLARFWKGVKEAWHDAGLIAIFLRFSPLDPASRDAASRLVDVELIRHGDTIAVPIHSAEEAWMGLKGRARTAIRKADRAGLTASVRSACEIDLGPGSPFRMLYLQAMQRVGSAPGYLFGDDYYTSLVTGLGANLLLAEARMPDGRVVAAALVLRHGDRMHYHLAGSDPVAANGCANNLLIWELIRWGSANGMSILHLGGGVKVDDSLFRFKASFGGSRGQFWTGAAVLEPSAYDRLVVNRASVLGMAPGALRQSGYFPAYRFGEGVV